MPLSNDICGLADGLDGLDGVAYWTDLEGILRGGGARNWQAFTATTGSAPLGLASMVGRSIFDIVDGADVRDLYRSLHDEVVSGRRHLVTFAYRCDAPDVERRMRMTMGPLRRGEAVVGVLYHSQMVSHRRRLPIRLFSYREGVKDLTEDASPVVTICSFCHDVRWPRTSDQWLSPELYYQAGGSSDVRLSHGVCNSCFDRVAHEESLDGW